jgi:hypothetical protein
VKVDTSRFLDAIIYICENGCTWRALPETFGPWAYHLRQNQPAGKNRRLGTNFSRSPGGTGNKQADKVVSLDSSSVKIHPDGTGAFKKNGE